MLRLAILLPLIASLPAALATADRAPVAAPPPAWNIARPEPAPSIRYSEEEPVLFTFFGFRPAGAEEAVSTLIENGENGSEHVAINTGSATYTVLQDSVSSEGDYAFHLNNDDFQDGSVQLLTPINASSDTHLYFESWLRRAFDQQRAKVQVSTDGGISWPYTVYDQPGTMEQSNSAEQIDTDATFQMREVDLSSFAGQTIRLRFLFDYTGGYAFTSTTDTVGWFFDNIQVGPSFTKRPYSIGDPTGEEQYSLELVNRARADADAEAQLLATTTDPDVLDAITYFGVNLTRMVDEFATLETTTQPLSFNAKLNASARLHTQDMYENTFQEHVSSPTPPPPNQSGDSPGMRAVRQGYLYTYLGENVYANAESLFHGHAGFEIDWGNDANDDTEDEDYVQGVDNLDGMQDPPGHRENIHNPAYKEIGIGIVSGTKTGQDWTNGYASNTVGPQLVTQDVAIPQSNSAFITGVIFDDADGDKVYDPGEGVGGVRIDVDGSVYYALSASSGGYSVPVSADGSYTVTFTAPGYPIITRTVTITDLKNVKQDWRRLRLRVAEVTHNTSNQTTLTFDPEHESPEASFTLLKASSPGGPYTEVSGAIPAGPIGDNDAYIYTYQGSPGENVFLRVQMDD